MKWQTACFAALALLGLGGPLQAQPVKIGMVTTLSTPGGYLGDDIRKGFELAIRHGGGKLGGVEVELLVEDDGLNPGAARQTVTRMIQRDGVRILTGVVFSNVAMATVPQALREGVFYISPNAGPAQLAGKGCHPNYFNVAYQNDNFDEAMGQYVSDQGYDNVFLLAPNYPAGRDHLAGFKRFYRGKVAAEVYTQLGQTDFAAEIAQIRAAKPGAVFFFLPGGMGINFTKQYAQAGLAESIPLFGPTFSFDNTLVNAVGDAALGVFNTAQWSADLDNPANRRFVADYIEAYGRLPTLYAAQGYDAAQLIGSALQATGGDLSDPTAFRAALREARFESVRGKFRFGANQHPIQDVYVRKVVRGEDGKLANVIVAKVFEDHVDAYAAECKLD
ncbi:MAG: ABC transporter substrate-binding protein [Xanthomonadaceae bacterium]|nr:ABC transporter substrate-binding protein [Xanthomonadaceae bacterium]